MVSGTNQGGHNHPSTPPPYGHPPCFTGGDRQKQNPYRRFSSIASSVWVAEVMIGVPGPKMRAAPALCSSS